MSSNLLDTAKSLITNELVSKAGSFLGESESGVSKAIGGLLPTILGGIADKAGTGEGADILFNLAKEQNDSGLLDNLGDLLGGKNTTLISKAPSLISSILGNKSNSIVDLISSFAGIKSSSSNSLLNMLMPVILGMLGNKAASSGLNAGGLASLLGQEKNSFLSALPSGLNLGNLFGNAGSAASAAASSARNFANEATESAKGGNKWLLPLLLLAALAALIWWFAKGGCGKTDESVIVDDTTAVIQNVEPVSTVGTLDADGNFVYNLGNIVDFNLPDGTKLSVGEFSTEAKLINFLNGNDELDTEKGNWFDFTNVRFNTGSSTITDESMTQLQNLVAISKAYPNAKFKVGGYTDNTGNPEANVKLSQSRAEAVAKQVVTLGAAQAAITGAEGYGEKHPIGDNNTDEGRAQNRRVSVKVEAK